MAVKKLNLNSHKHKNITYQQHQAILQLQNNRDITIKMADKGGNVVVMDTENYRQMCLDILCNEE